MTKVSRATTGEPDEDQKGNCLVTRVLDLDLLTLLGGPVVLGLMSNLSIRCL
jgi:hypothetical protein